MVRTLWPLNPMGDLGRLVLILQQQPYATPLKPWPPPYRPFHPPFILEAVHVPRGYYLKREQMSVLTKTMMKTSELLKKKKNESTTSHF